MSNEETSPRDMEVVDAWFVKNYPVREIIEYMEKHNLMITKNNYGQIKKALDDKFVTIEKYIRQHRKEHNVQYYRGKRKYALK
jgi:hypothetical protein